MRILLLLLIIFYQTQANAKEFDVSLGVGAPYFLVAEVSTAVNNDYKLYLNYKYGLDDGYSLGLDKAVFNDNHLLGLFIGAVGTKSTGCVYNDSEDLLNDVSKYLVSCQLAVIKQKTLNGLGVSYSYAYGGINNSGFILKLDMGSGTNSYIDGYQSTAGITVLYSF